MPANYYVDDDTIIELDILRRIVHVEKTIRDMDGSVNEHNGYIRSGLYQTLRRLVKDHDDFLDKSRERFNEAVGIVVGRFQLDKLHASHRSLIQTVMDRHSCYAVVLGITMDDKPTDKNPLPFHMRASMVLDDFPNCVTIPLKDCNDDNEWSKELDQAIRTAFPMGTVRLYGGRDSFVPVYTGEFPTTEITTIDGSSGTSVRHHIGESPATDLQFRRGIIFATQNIKESK